MMLEGHQERSAKNLVEAIERSKQNDLSRLLFALAYAISGRKRRSFSPSILAILIL